MVDKILAMPTNLGIRRSHRRLLSLFWLREHVHHEAELVVSTSVVDRATEANTGEVRHAAADLAIRVEEALDASVPEGILVGKLEARLAIRVRILELGPQAQAVAELPDILQAALVQVRPDGRLGVGGPAQRRHHDVPSVCVAHANLANRSDTVHCDAGQVSTKLQRWQDALREGTGQDPGALPSELRAQGPITAGVLEGALMHVPLHVLQVGVGRGLELYGLANLLDGPAVHTPVQAGPCDKHRPSILALECRAELVDVLALAQLRPQEERVRSLKILRHLVGRLDSETVPVVLLRHVLPLAAEHLELHGWLFSGCLHAPHGHALAIRRGCSWRRRRHFLGMSHARKERPEGATPPRCTPLLHGWCTPLHGRRAELPSEREQNGYSTA
mmetsp:Transcript_74087/g.165763  ORF Transcript_74087/g.165763 Transcript_74087/m.165763 type:complete len:389 (+) Transcript_74087:66-1232(+)